MKKVKIDIIRNWNDYILCSQKKCITNNRLLFLKEISFMNRRFSILFEQRSI